MLAGLAAAALAGAMPAAAQEASAKAAVSPDPRPGLGLPRATDIPDSPSGLGNGVYAPDLQLYTVGGEPYRLSRRIGREADRPAKAALVGFVASWCGPCKKSLPKLVELKKAHGDDLEIVLVTTDVKPEGKRLEAAHVKAAGLDAPVLVPTADELRAYLGRRRNVPHFYIVNQIGEVLVQTRGYGKNAARVLPKQINYALRHPEYVDRTKKKPASQAVTAKTEAVQGG